MKFRIEMLLMLEGIALLLLAGIPAVITYMSMQGLALIDASRFFALHWYFMLFGFFLALIGNEILLALSLEWSGKTAPRPLFITFALSILASAIIAVLYPSQPYYLYITFFSLLILLYHARIYFKPSRFGLKPISYNYLIFLTLALTALISILLANNYPRWLALAFPSLMIFSVMSRDIGLIFGGRIVDSKLMVIAYLALLSGFLLYPSQYASISFFVGWLVSLYASGILKAKGMLYPKLCLSLAWLWLFFASIFSALSYDAFIHSIAVGYLFNTIFGVDVVLLDLLMAVFGVRVKVKPSYIPVLLLNLGLAMRVLFDLGLSHPLLLLAAPLQGLGIISFFFNMLRQVLPQILRSEAKPVIDLERSRKIIY